MTETLRSGHPLGCAHAECTAETAIRRAHAAGKCLALGKGSVIQPHYGDYNEHDVDAGPKREVTPEEAFDCYLGHRECARCRWLRAHLGLTQHRTFTAEEA